MQRTTGDKPATFTCPRTDSTLDGLCFPCMSDSMLVKVVEFIPFGALDLGALRSTLRVEDLSLYTTA